MRKILLAAMRPPDPYTLQVVSNGIPLRLRWRWKGRNCDWSYDCSFLAILVDRRGLCHWHSERSDVLEQARGPTQSDDLISSRICTFLDNIDDPKVVKSITQWHFTARRSIPYVRCISCYVHISYAVHGSVGIPIQLDEINTAIQTHDLYAWCLNRHWNGIRYHVHRYSCSSSAITVVLTMSLIFTTAFRWASYPQMVCHR